MLIKLRLKVFDDLTNVEIEPPLDDAPPEFIKAVKKWSNRNLTDDEYNQMIKELHDAAI